MRTTEPMGSPSRRPPVANHPDAALEFDTRAVPLDAPEGTPSPLREAFEAEQSAPLAGDSCGLTAGRQQSKIRVAGQFLGATPRPFGQPTFGRDLQAPGDPFHEPGFVPGSGFFAEQLAIALTQLANAETGEC